MKLIRCNSEDPNFVKLVAQLDDDLNVRYGNIQKQYEVHNKIDLIETVVVAYIGDNAVGCGCFKRYDDSTVEIKRVFVAPDFRGLGVANRIMTELEIWASEIDFRRLILETGIKQHEAINLYLKLGYSQIENFGNYLGNENSICMEKFICRIL